MQSELFIINCHFISSSSACVNGCKYLNLIESCYIHTLDLQKNTNTSARSQSLIGWQHKNIQIDVHSHEPILIHASLFFTYIVFKLSDFFLQQVCSHLVILNHTTDLQLPNTITNRYQLGGSPQQSVNLY